MNLNILVIGVLLICVNTVKQIATSAIPMWEFLSKNEKMDILTSVLSDLVDQLCIEVSSESNVIVNCENLLNSGLEKLNKLPEDDMDELDPFQRNAQSIIWNSLIEKHNLRYNYDVKSSNDKSRTDSGDLFDEFNNFFDNDNQNIVDTNSLNHDYQQEGESKIFESKVLPDGASAKSLFSKFFEKLSSVYTKNLQDANVEVRLFPNGSHVPDEINEITKQNR